MSDQLNFFGESDESLEYKPYYMMDVEISSSKKLFTVISTFSGGGGSSLGYKLAGGDVLVANEFVEEASNTYLANSPKTKMLTDDIKEITGQDLLDTVNLKKGELDILDGSPPCSFFSTASRWSKSKSTSNVKNYSDGKKVENIEDLFYEYIRIASDIMPKVIIAENVPSMLNQDHRKYFDNVINGFSDIGYYPMAKCMDASNYSVPQSRVRCIFICVRSDIADSINIGRHEIHNIYPRGSHRFISIKNAIDDVNNNQEDIDTLIEYYERGGFQKKWMSKLPKNPDKLMKASHIHPTQSLFNLIRPCPDLPSPTLTQTGQQLALSGVFHYNEDRKLSVQELMRLTTLPEDFVLTGTFDQRAERVCRMVPPKLMYAVAESVYENVLKLYNQEEEKEDYITPEVWDEYTPTQLDLF